jgi:DNA relaxase NicK
MEHVSISTCGHRTFVACYEVIERCSYVPREGGKCLFSCVAWEHVSYFLRDHRTRFLHVLWQQNMFIVCYMITEHVYGLSMAKEHVYSYLRDHRTRFSNILWPQNIFIDCYVNNSTRFWPVLWPQNIFIDCYVITEHVFGLLYNHRTRLWLFYGQRTCL